MPITPDHLPDDPAALKRIIAAMAQDTLTAQAEIARLKFQLARYRRAEFGRSSEKLAHEAEQLELALEALETDQAERLATASPEVAAAVETATEAQKPARRPLPQHLPREDRRHPAPCTCPSCGGALRKIAEEVSETLDYVPGRFKVIRHIREKLSCRTCDTVVAPDGAGTFTAQIFDDEGQFLFSRGANGGPVALSQQLAKFFIGVNDPFGPTGAVFNPEVFDIYSNWGTLHGRSQKSERRQAIVRGEELFNTTKFNITGVAGLNDALNQPSISGFCSTCHDTPNAGNHSVPAPLNIGVADAGTASPPALDISGLPVFTIWCTSGPLAGQMFEVTDPGRALITGKCADIGKVKGPILRGLSARAPYFHNGSAATLADVVEFYNQRFDIGFTDQQKADLVAFLSAL